MIHISELCNGDLTEVNGACTRFSRNRREKEPHPNFQFHTLPVVDYRATSELV